MELVAGQVHVFGPGRRIQAVEHPLDPGLAPRQDAAVIPFAEEALKPSVFERPDHGNV